MPHLASVTVYQSDEELPAQGTMLLAFDGAEWHILMYEADDIGYEWECDEPVRFIRWAYLSDLDHMTPQEDQP